MRNKDQNLLSSFGNIKDENFNFEQIGNYFSKNKSTDYFQRLSDKTCADLDFEDLYIFLDRTYSRPGQQYLYNQLKTIPLNNKKTKLQEEIISEISTNDKLKLFILKNLKKLNSREAYDISTLFLDKHTKAPKWFSILPFLVIGCILCLVLMFFKGIMFLGFLGIFIVNMGIHYWNKKNLYRYIGSVPPLLRSIKIASDLFKNKSLQKLNPNLDKDLKTIRQIQKGMFIFQLEAGLQSDLGAIVWILIEFIKITFLLEPLSLFRALKKLDKYRQEQENIFRFIGEIDMLQSIAALRLNLNKYCIPAISENHNLQFEKIYHPLIKNCVTNDFQYQNKSILLTGSNMSGKTSFMRTIGINMITGLTINTCFASSISFSRMQIHSAIRISDDLLNDKSYYFEEVTTINDMLHQANSDRKNLFLLDEIYKGTNTIERISAGKAVLSYLSKSNNLVFVATHDIELTELLEDQYDLYHFSEIVSDNTVDFDYKLKKGRLKKRNAIRILELNNYPKEIIEEAMELSEKLTGTTLISRPE